MHPSFRPFYSTCSLGGLPSVSCSTEDYKVSHSRAGITLSACVLCLCVLLEAGKRETVKKHVPKDNVLSSEQEIPPIPSSRNQIYVQFTPKLVIQIETLFIIAVVFVFESISAVFYHISLFLKNSLISFHNPIKHIHNWFVLHILISANITV